MPAASRRHKARSGSARVISGVSAGQPYHSPSRWMPSIVVLPQRHSANIQVPVKLDIIAQNRCLGDNFSALQQRCARQCRVRRASALRAFRSCRSRGSDDRSVDCAESRVRSAARRELSDTVLLANAIRALAMDAVQAANSGPSRHADGHGGDRRRAVEPPSAPQSRRIRTGPTATASCSPTATARCCSTRCCISPATTCRSRS